MPWWLWLLLAYAAVSIVIGAFSAAIAWDYNPGEAFWVAALTWPALLAAFLLG